MLAAKLVQFLLRSEVKEIALHTGRPPCALVEDAYRRLSPQLLKEEDIIAVLAALQGQEHLAHLADGRSWEFQDPTAGTIVVSATYDAHGVKASLRLSAAGAAALAAAAAARAAKRPSREPKPAKRSQRPPRPAAGPPQPAAAARRGGPVALEAVSLPPAAAEIAEDVPSDESLNRGRQIDLRQARANDAAATGGRAQPAGLRLGRELEAPPAGEDSGLALDVEANATRSRSSRPALPAFKGDQLDDLLRTALERRASDLHVIAERPALIRLAGELVGHGAPLSAATVEELVLPRVPGDKRAELEQSGSCDFALDHPAYGRFRANVNRQRTGYKLTVRPIGARIPTLEELGMPEAIRKATHHHQGLIVVTGPTGHGKTTTMAAIVGILNRETTHHVITVEDPVEYVHPNAKAVISQREVGKHTKSFQAALKGSLREDPDVIVVGELRDTETVRMALSASETGHLVISTMNTPSAAKAIERLIDLFPPGDQPQVRMTLAGGLRLVISQRLLPTADRKGLCAAAELLPGSMALWSLIRDNRTFQITSLQQRGKSLGIIRLDDSLAELVRSGKTTLEIAREYAEAPATFDALVAGRPVQPAEPAGEDAGERAAAAAKRGMEMGKQVLSRAGKLFGNESK